MADRHWGDVASVAGVAIAVVGFAITISNTRRTKAAVLTLKSSLGRLSAVSNLSKAVAIMNEIKRLHREHTWAALPDRYADLRHLLVEISNVDPPLLDHHTATILQAIDDFRKLENTVEKACELDDEGLDVPKLNSAVSKQVDKLVEVLAQVRNQIGR